MIVTCPECGPQTLKASGLHLTRYSHGDHHSYAFFCPVCTDEVTRPASAEIVVLLMQAGVHSTQIHVPDEVLEHPPDAVPAITAEDVMEFVTELRSFGKLIAPDDKG